MKKLITFALILLALGGTVMAIIKQTGGASDAVQAGVGAEAALPRDGVVVTYFTNDIRCSACVQMEKMTRESVAGFRRVTADTGEVVFRMVNVDRAENRHFIEDYQLVSKSVVVSHRRDGQEVDWRNLQDVWLLLGDRVGFINYVTMGIDGF